jgi:hypothetical protein
MDFVLLRNLLAVPAFVEQETPQYFSVLSIQQSFQNWKFICIIFKLDEQRLHFFRVYF